MMRVMSFFIAYVMNRLRGFSIIRKLYMPISCSIIMILSKLTNKMTMELTIHLKIPAEISNSRILYFAFLCWSNCFCYSKGCLLFLPKVGGRGNKIFLPGWWLLSFLKSPRFTSEHASSIVLNKHELKNYHHCTFIVLVARDEYNSVSYF